MGHYASEMRGWDEPPDEDPNAKKWLVDNDLTVMQASTFDQKYSQSNTYYGSYSPVVLRMNKKHFDTKAEALAHRFTVADEQIERARIALETAKIDLSIKCAQKQKLLSNE